MSGLKRTNDKGAVKYVCDQCGSTDVGVDAATYWNEERQVFEVGALYDTPDHVWCNDEECCKKGKPVNVIPVKL